MENVLSTWTHAYRACAHWPPKFNSKPGHTPSNMPPTAGHLRSLIPPPPHPHRQQLVLMLTECAANSCSPAEPACQTCTDLLALAATRPNPPPAPPTAGAYRQAPPTAGAYWLCSQRPSMPVQISQDRQNMPAKHATNRFYSTEDSSQAASNLAATRCEF